jgi:hypothetical protein
MGATINSDGSINFKDESSCLLSTRSITSAAMGLIKASMERNEQSEQSMKVRELRKSCGVENSPITIKRPEKYHG